MGKLSASVAKCWGRPRPLDVFPIDVCRVQFPASNFACALHVFQSVAFGVYGSRALIMSGTARTPPTGRLR